MAQVRQQPGPGREPLKAAIAGLGKKSGKAGWFESAKYENGQQVAEVAAIQEYGAPGKSIPARPTMRPTATAQGPEWQRVAAAVSTNVLAGTMPPDALVEALSLKAEADVRRAISRLMDPPLSLLTLQARKYRNDGGTVTGATLGKLMGDRHKGPPDVSGVNAKPLVDSRVLINTLTSKVE